MQILLTLLLQSTNAYSKSSYDIERVFCVGEAGVASVNLYIPWKEHPCRLRFRRPVQGRSKTSNLYPSSVKQCRKIQKKKQESLELKNWKCA